MVSYSLLSSFPALLGEIRSRWVTPMCPLALSAFAAPTARGCPPLPRIPQTMLPVPPPRRELAAWAATAHSFHNQIIPVFMPR